MKRLEMNIYSCTTCPFYSSKSEWCNLLQLSHFVIKNGIGINCPLPDETNEDIKNKSLNESLKLIQKDGIGNYAITPEKEGK